ncbi:MAG: hypothetical protein ACLQOO_27175 [Terriglobia bacterium]
MAKIHVRQLSEVIHQLPEAQRFGAADRASVEGADMLLCAVGFEERCLTIPSLFDRNRISVPRSIYFEYSTNREDNGAHRGQFIEHLQNFSGAVDRLDADEEGLVRSLRESFSSLGAKISGREPLVLFDISVGSNRLLMRVLKVLLEARVRLTLLYSEAAIYHPTQVEYESEPSKWREPESLGLERGVDDVEFSEEYPGYHVDQLPDCITIVTGYNADRARAAISKVDPFLLSTPQGKVVWLVGLPHLPEDQWRTSLVRAIHKLGSEEPQYEVSTFDYRDILRVLDDLYQQRCGQFRFTLAPLGSRLQALGESLFCYLRPEMRVIFVTPQQYNAARYSEGCKNTWMIEFGSVTKIRGLLDDVGKVSIED